MAALAFAVAVVLSIYGMSLTQFGFGTLDPSFFTPSMADPPPSGTKNKPTLVYLHFHKAGGTSVVQSLLQNHIYKAWNPILEGQWCGTCEPNNGMPYESFDTIFPIWEYNASEWETFLRTGRARNVSLIALEWDFFHNFSAIYAADKYIEWVTVLRDPYERFVSEYHWEITRSQSHPIIYEDFVSKHMHASHPKNLPVNHNQANYYVKMLNGMGNVWDLNVTEAHFNQACMVLQRFTKVVPLQADALRKAFDIDIPKRNHIEDKSVPIDRKTFEAHNVWDVRLFDHFVGLDSLEHNLPCPEPTNTENTIKQSTSG